MHVLIIDGQGGRIGRLFIENLKKKSPQIYITAIGTNSIATAAMLKAGADDGATGENPVIVNCNKVDLIVGPIGIVLANSLLGEVTPKMAEAVASSNAKKLLFPISKCNNTVIGVQQLSLPEFIELAIKECLHLFSLSSTL